MFNQLETQARQLDDLNNKMVLARTMLKYREQSKFEISLIHLDREQD